MKYFIDTHDKTKGSFPAQELTEEEFFAQFAALEIGRSHLAFYQSRPGKRRPCVRRDWLNVHFCTDPHPVRR